MINSLLLLIFVHCDCDLLMYVLKLPFWIVMETVMLTRQCQDQYRDNDPQDQDISGKDT